MKKLIIFIIIVLVIGAGIWYFIVNKPEETNQLNNNQIVGGDKDEHGCIGSAGYTWCENKQKCLRIWEENCYDDMEQQIQCLLSEKYDKPISDITIKTTKKDDNYAVGTVNFAAENLFGSGEGGLFVAVKVNDVWALIYDGNGSIDCAGIKASYQFPQEMLSGLCD